MRMDIKHDSISEGFSRHFIGYNSKNAEKIVSIIILDRPLPRSVLTAATADARQTSASDGQQHHENR